MKNMRVTEMPVRTEHDRMRVLAVNRVFNALEEIGKEELNWVNDYSFTIGEHFTKEDFATLDSTVKKYQGIEWSFSNYNGKLKLTIL